MHLKPTIEKVERLEKEVPKKKEEMKKLQNDLIECNTETETIQALLAEPTVNMDLANSMMGDMSLLDEAMKQVTRLGEEISRLKTKLPQGTGDDNTSIDDLQAEKTAVFAELEEKRKFLEQNQQYYEKNMEALNKLRELKNA